MEVAKILDYRRSIEKKNKYSEWLLVLVKMLDFLIAG